MMRHAATICALCLMVAINLSLAGQYDYPAGTPVPELRNEFADVYSTGDGHLVVKVFAAPINRLDENGAWQPLGELDNDVVRCYPDILTFWTGNIMKKNNNYLEKNNSTVWIQGAKGSEQRHFGWFKFNLSLLPNQMNVDTVRLWYWVSEIGQPAAARVTHVTDDPVPMSTATLGNQIENGTQFSAGGSHGQSMAWTAWELNATARATVKQRMLSSDWIAMGLDCDDNDQDKHAYITGYDGDPAHRPYLEVSLSQPPFVDIEAVSVMAPTGPLPEGNVVTPIGRWRNTGNVPSGCDIWFKLFDPHGVLFYEQQVTVENLAVDKDTVHVFSNSDPLTPAGTWVARCSTRATSDIDETNDTVSLPFLVSTQGSNIDVAAEYIEEPSGLYGINEDILPEATWQNNSALSANFVAFFTLINPGGERVRNWSASVVGLAAGMDTTLIFAPPYNVGTVTGTWVARCSTWASGDIDPENDVLENVLDNRTGWTSVGDKSAAARARELTMPKRPVLLHRGLRPRA